MNRKISWFVQSVAGLLLTGTGLSMSIDAGFSRAAGGDWFWYGTGALVLFQAGICLLIDAAQYRSK